MTMQAFTSAATSINAARLPAVFGKLPERPPVLLDYGCGRYTDHIRAALPGTEYLPFDLFNQPADVNRASLRAAADHRAAGHPLTVTCSNVLNVIAEDDIIQGIADAIADLISGGGAAYITVYEGDRSGRGKQTGPDQWQRNAPLRDYLRFFPGAVVRRGMIILESGKGA